MDGEGVAGGGGPLRSRHPSLSKRTHRAYASPSDDRANQQHVLRAETAWKRGWGGVEEEGVSILFLILIITQPRKGGACENKQKINCHRRAKWHRAGTGLKKPRPGFLYKRQNGFDLSTTVSSPGPARA